MPLHPPSVFPSHMAVRHGEDFKAVIRNLETQYEKKNQPVIFDSRSDALLRQASKVHRDCFKNSLWRYSAFANKAQITVQ